tara:strand:+ start:212 stop:313 length:102 start_codon:yes stop_codon:yes gene_type:complete
MKKSFEFVINFLIVLGAAAIFIGLVWVAMSKLS